MISPDRVIAYAKVALFGAAAFALIALGAAALQLRTTEASLQRTSDQAASSIYQLGLTTQQTEKAVSDDSRRLTEHADHVLNVAGIAAAEATKVSRAQGDYLVKEVPRLGGDFETALGNINTLSAKLTETATTATGSIGAIKPLLEHSTTLIDSANTAVKDGDALAKNQDIPRLIKSGADLTQHSAGFMVHMEGMSVDAEKKFHKITNPSRWEQIEGGLLLGLDISEKLALTRASLP